MRTVCIVVAAPAFDEHLRLVQRIEEFAVQQLIPEFPVKGLDIPVLPRIARLDEQGCHPCFIGEVVGRHRYGTEAYRVTVKSWRNFFENQKKQPQRAVHPEMVGSRQRVGRCVVFGNIRFMLSTAPVWEAGLGRISYPRCRTAWQDKLDPVTCR